MKRGNRDYESTVDEIGYSPYARVNYDKCKLALDWWNSKRKWEIWDNS